MQLPRSAGHRGRTKSPVGRRLGSIRFSFRDESGGQMGDRREESVSLDEVRVMLSALGWSLEEMK
jgi:hypothetical protein